MRICKTYSRALSKIEVISILFNFVSDSNSIIDSTMPGTDQIERFPGELTSPILIIWFVGWTAREPPLIRPLIKGFLEKGLDCLMC